MVLAGERQVRNCRCGGGRSGQGYCCFCVIERFLKGRGELEFAVEGVEGDE